MYHNHMPYLIAISHTIIVVQLGGQGDYSKQFTISDGLKVHVSALNC